MTRHDPRNNRSEESVPERRDDRDVAHDSPPHRRGGNPGPDESERGRGGDQDIDTAGQVPGNMQTDIDDGTGL